MVLFDDEAQNTTLEEHQLLLRITAVRNFLGALQQTPQELELVEVGEVEVAAREKAAEDTMLAFNIDGLMHSADRSCSESDDDGDA